MTHSRRCTGFLFLGAFLILLAAPAGAQDLPRAELSAGWRLLTVPDALEDGESQTLTKGWYVDVAGNLNDVFAVVGEVSGAYKSFDETIVEFGAAIDVDADIDLHTFMGGIRFSARQNPRFVPFAQALFGVARSGFSVEGSATFGGQTIRLDESGSETDFAFDAGGGVNFSVSDGLGVRVGASYLRIGGDDGGNGFRFGVGIVMPF